MKIKNQKFFEKFYYDTRLVLDHLSVAKVHYSTLKHIPFTCLSPKSNFRIITQPIAVISFPTYLTVFLALTFLKSDVSRKYQLFLIWNVIENFALDVGTGLLSHLGFSGTIQFLITCLIVNSKSNIISIMILLEKKMIVTSKWL
nr:hypothetical protein F19G12.5 - Caenorhabditis elegans [Caenorhabditis elegans]